MVSRNLILFVVLRMLCEVSRATPAPLLCAPSLPQSCLPSPPPGSIAKVVAQGIGTQIYKCSHSVPSSVGAVASLFDITHLQCPGLADKAEQQQGPIEIGHHYFTKEAVPTFDLTKSENPFVFSATKAANVMSPNSTVSPGIDWLYLVPNIGAPNKGGVKAAYRVRTVGGAPVVPCTGDQEVRYTAEYWFFF